MRYLENGIYEVYTPDNKRFELSREDLAYLLKEFNLMEDISVRELTNEIAILPSNDCCDDDVIEAAEYAAKYIIDNYHLIPKE